MIGNGWALTRVAGRLLARLARRTRSCSASTAPPGPRRTSCAPTRTASRRRQARPPQARARARPLLVPRRDRLGPRGLPPASGGIVRREMEQHARRRHIEGGYTYVYTPHITKAGPVPDQSNHLVTYKEGMFPPDPHGRGARRRGRRSPSRAGLLPEAHELPDAHPDLQGARAQLPRPADAARRERHRVPQRAVRRAARAHPRARLHAGRLPPLRHAASSSRSEATTSSSSSSRCCATSASTTSSSSCRCKTTRRSGRLRRVLGVLDGGAPQRRPSSGLKLDRDPGEAAFYGPKIT